MQHSENGPSVMDKTAASASETAAAGTGLSDDRRSHKDGAAAHTTSSASLGDTRHPSPTPALALVGGDANVKAAADSLNVKDVEAERASMRGEGGGGGDDVEGGGEDARGSWGNKLGFILTCISFSVGLGNVWRFPYLCYKNGGGAFLLPFILMLAVVGMPLFFMELAFGQFASLGPIAIWKINPLFKGLGFGMVSVSWLIAVYYNVVIAHVLLYLIKSLGSIVWGLPWTTCGNDWNTELCMEQQYPSDSDVNGTSHASNYTTVATTTGYLSSSSSLPRSTAPFNTSVKRHTPAEEYFNNYVLEMSRGIDDDGTVNWKLALCLLLAWTIVLICLIRGIKSMGKVVYFTALFPYVMLTILLIRGLTLPGAWEGIKFYVTPDFDKIWSITVWSDAATQIFYSLSCCCGGLIAMASYNDFKYNCLRDSLIVPIINCLTSVFAGFVIFSILGFMAHEKGVQVKDVATGGPGLAFVVYPEALSRMPAPQLWAIFFFFMMANLGFGSEFSLVECVLSAFTDEFPSVLRKKWHSYIFRTSVIIVTFLLGLPMVTRNGMYLLNLVDASVSGFPLLFIGLFECLAIGWIYGLKNFSDDICLMLGARPNFFWKICWMFVAPAVFMGLIVCGVVFYQMPTMGQYAYPVWAVGLGWLISLFPILLLPLYAIYYMCRHGGLQLFRDHLRPIDQWGPALRENRDGTRYDRVIGAHDVPFGAKVDDEEFAGETSEFLTRLGDGNECIRLDGSKVSSQPTMLCDNETAMGTKIGKYPIQVAGNDSGCEFYSETSNGRYPDDVTKRDILTTAHDGGKVAVDSKA